jgi:hypothetical protein
MRYSIFMIVGGIDAITPATPKLSLLNSFDATRSVAGRRSSPPNPARTFLQAFCKQQKILADAPQTRLFV